MKQRSQIGRSRNARRSAHQRAAAQCPLPVGHRLTHARHDGHRVREDVPRAGVRRCGHSAPASCPRHLRPRVSQLHDGQADDASCATTGLRAEAARKHGATSTISSWPTEGRPFHGKAADDGQRRRRTFLNFDPQRSPPAGGKILSVSLCLRVLAGICWGYNETRR
jgi:hypothetical protein